MGGFRIKKKKVETTQIIFNSKTGCTLFFPGGQKGTRVRTRRQAEVNITRLSLGAKAARTQPLAVAALPVVKVLEKSPSRKAGDRALPALYQDQEAPGRALRAGPGLEHFSLEWGPFLQAINSRRIWSFLGVCPGSKQQAAAKGESERSEKR